MQRCHLFPIAESLKSNMLCFFKVIKYQKDMNTLFGHPGNGLVTEFFALDRVEKKA